MSISLNCQVSAFFPGLMASKPCHEQAVFTWIVFSRWCAGRPASKKFLCESAGASGAKVEQSLASLLAAGLIAEERVTEAVVGYIPTILCSAMGGPVAEVAPEPATEKPVVKPEKGAKPPSLATIEAVVRVKGWKFDPKAFHAFYADRGWVTRDGVPVTTRNWYHMAKNWADRADRGGPGAASHEDATA